MYFGVTKLNFLLLNFKSIHFDTFDNTNLTAIAESINSNIDLPNKVVQSASIGVILVKLIGKVYEFLVKLLKPLMLAKNARE